MSALVLVGAGADNGGSVGVGDDERVVRMAVLMLVLMFGLMLVLVLMLLMVLVRWPSVACVPVDHLHPENSGIWCENQPSPTALPQE